jgi:hypothetical protein
MADGNSGGGNSFLAFVVGGLLVVVAVFGFILYSGGHIGGKKSVDVNLNIPSAPAGPGAAGD